MAWCLNSDKPLHESVFPKMYNTILLGHKQLMSSIISKLIYHYISKLKYVASWMMLQFITYETPPKYFDLRWPPLLRHCVLVSCIMDQPQTDIDDKWQCCVPRVVVATGKEISLAHRVGEKKQPGPLRTIFQPPVIIGPIMWWFVEPKLVICDLSNLWGA